MKQETIDKLTILADDAYASHQSPDTYARTAAHIAAVDAASMHNTECADTAALFAASSFVAATTLAASFSANIADTANQKTAYKRSYDTAIRSFSTTIAPITLVANEPFYLPLVQKVFSVASESKTHIAGSYESNPPGSTAQSNFNAKRAAIYAYSDTYTSTRSAYVRAMFIASFEKDDKKAQTKFSATMKSRLNKDLKYDTIQPGFFLRLMCSTSIRIIAGLLLLAGIIAIVLGSCGVAAATLPFIPTVAIGSASAALGTGILIGTFFARRKKHTLDEANLNRMDMGLPV